jgi:choline dehydrogenase-like flavoprotein
MRDEQVAPNVLDGYVIEEGAVPEALSHLLGTMFKVIPDKIHPTGLSPLDYLSKLASQIDTKILGPYSPDSSINRTMIYLVMSHDDNQATLTLEKDKPYLRFEGVARSQNVTYINNVLAKATNLIGGTFIQNPFFAKEFGQKEITVHPVGGANMSSDGTGSAGVTDHFGQVFKGLGSEVYDGLVVVDGAVVPAALGVNPFATITAFAERSVEGVAVAKGYTIDYEDKNGMVSKIAHD